MSHVRIRIGTRGSDLALWQARHVSRLLAERGFAETEIVIVHTSGDRDRSRALHELPGSGFFTKELQRALLDGDVDAVVHSLKDLPIEEPQGLELAAVPERADPRDTLLVRGDALGDGGLGLRRGARLGTSSLRRAALSLALQPDLSLSPLRGNVPTRISRLREGAFDAILLAKAGLDRLALDLEGLHARPLPFSQFLPSPGQGALAIETRAGDDQTLAVVAPLHDARVADAVTCERLVLKGLGGGCHLPLGAFAESREGVMWVDVAWGQIDARLSAASVVRASGFGATPTEASRAALDDLAQRRGEP